MARVHPLVAQDLAALLVTKTQIGTPQARWRETTQSGRLAIMPVMRFSPDSGTHSGRRDGVEREFAQAAVPSPDGLVHRDEPLRRVAEDAAGPSSARNADTGA
jgi:hypothetical protein